MAETKKQAPAAQKSSPAADKVLVGVTANLKKVVAEVDNAVKAVGSLADRSEELTHEISYKEQRIADIDVEYKEKLRQANLDLDMKMKETTATVVDAYLQSTGKVGVKADELKAERDIHAKLELEHEAAVKAAEGKAHGIASSKYAGEKALLEANFKATEASNTAEIKALNDKVKTLEAQSTMLIKQLDDERKAGVDRAKASAIGNVNIDAGNGSKR